MQQRNGRDVYVMGAANVGKSLFIGALLDLLHADQGGRTLTLTLTLTLPLPLTLALTLTLTLTPTLAQVDGHAVGLMATSSDIEVGLLRDCFELED